MYALRFKKPCDYVRAGLLLLQGIVINYVMCSGVFWGVQRAFENVSLSQYTNEELFTMIFGSGIALMMMWSIGQMIIYAFTDVENPPMQFTFAILYLLSNNVIVLAFWVIFNGFWHYPIDDEVDLIDVVLKKIRSVRQ